MDYYHRYEDSYYNTKDFRNLIELGLWSSNDGTQTFISDLEDDHLMNILSLLKRRVKESTGNKKMETKALLWKMRVERMLRLEEER